MNMNNHPQSFSTCPSRGMVRAGYLSGIKPMLQGRGFTREIFERQEIDPDALDDPDNDLPCSSVVNLLEYCSRALKDPLFGIHLAERQDPDAFGWVIAVARAAPTFRAGLQTLIEYTPLST